MTVERSKCHFLIPIVFTTMNTKKKGKTPECTKGKIESQHVHNISNNLMLLLIISMMFHTHFFALAWLCAKPAGFNLLNARHSAN